MKKKLKKYLRISKNRLTFALAIGEQPRASDILHNVQQLPKIIEMKKVTISDFIAIVADASASKQESGTKSINGQFASVTYFVGSVLKNGYYAKLQSDPRVKNPLWGHELTAIKSYEFSFAENYGKAKERDGKATLSGESNEVEEHYNTIVPNLIFSLKSDPSRQYIQVMAKARKADYYLDGEKVGEDVLATIKPFAKPYKGSGKSDTYKKLDLSKVWQISFGGETYEIVH